LQPLLQNSNGSGDAASIMKISSFLTLILLVVLTLASQSPAATPFNLVAGVGPVTSVNSWTGYSALSEVSGSGLYSKTSKTTTFYIGFTGGTTANLGNMVLYSTLTRSTKIKTVVPVKLGGVSNPTIKITDTSVCPSQPVTVSNPCIVRLDPLTLTLSTKDDYYLVTYFTTGTDISSTRGLFANTTLTGWFVGADETQLTVGKTLPGGNSGTPAYFLIAVMSD
jgi:hypothetical protein